MSFEQVKKNIVSWIENFVEQSNPKLNGWAPCPFARRSRLENKLKISKGTEVIVDTKTLISTWDDNFDVVIFVYNKEQYTVDELEACIEKINKEHAMPNDILLLEDHPMDPEIVNTVRMNQGQYILVLCQRFSKVNLASAELKEQGYYDVWSKEYYHRVAGWREQYVFGDN